MTERRVFHVLPKMRILVRLLGEGMSWNEAMLEADRIARETPGVCDKCASTLDSMDECPIGHD